MDSKKPSLWDSRRHRIIILCYALITCAYTIPQLAGIWEAPRWLGWVYLGIAVAVLVYMWQLEIRDRRIRKVSKDLADSVRTNA